MILQQCNSPKTFHWDFQCEVQIIIEGNYWNIYNLPQYFDKPVQPMLNDDEFLDCINIAFKAQTKLVHHAVAYVYMNQRCENTTERNEFYAEQVKVHH